MQRRTMGSIITSGLLAALMMVAWSGTSAAQAKQELKQVKPTLERKITRKPSLAAVDHYRCYDVKPHHKLKPQKAGLKDQFHSDTHRIGPIRSICAPVIKRHKNKITKARHPRIHLVCYALEPNKTIGRNVVTSNQFGRAKMTVVRERTLCVPSFKRLVK